MPILVTGDRASPRTTKHDFLRPGGTDQFDGEPTGVERILRAQIAGEAENTSASEFWASTRANQQDLLRAFSTRGAEAIVASHPGFGERIDWIGSTGNHPVLDCRPGAP